MGINVEEQRSKRREEKRVELTTPSISISNKMNEQGKYGRNKAILLFKGYSWKKCIDYEKTYSLLAIMEVVRMFLAYAVNKKQKVYQMDVK